MVLWYNSLKNRKRMLLFPYVREIPLLRKLHKNMASGRKKRRYNSYMGEISPAVPNLLERDFHADKPNKKWVTDITEFGIPAGKVYFSPIIDCFDDFVVSWSIGTSLDAELVNSMLDGGAACLTKNKHPQFYIPIAMATIAGLAGSHVLIRMV